MEKIPIQVCNKSGGTGYTAFYKVKEADLMAANGETLAEAVEALKSGLMQMGIGTDNNFQVLYFGDADIDSVFLTSGEGITSTSANYLANLAQEVIQEKKLSIENISFLNSKIVTPLCPQGIEYSKANYDLDKLEQTIDEIAKFNTFCAWIREGIKAKEAMKDAIDRISFEIWMEAFNRRITSKSFVKFSRLKFMSGNGLSIGERFNMLKSEAIASTYGKLIHQDSPISNARKALQNKTVNPVEMTGAGQDLTIYKYEPAASIEEVDANFMRLQNRQREAEKELNQIKAQMRKAMEEKEVEESALHAEYMEEHKKSHAELLAIYNAEMAMVRDYSSNLKIIIPEALKETYQYLNNLGK